MVESVGRVLKQYQNERRINVDAALQALDMSDGEEPRRVPLDLNTQYLIDAFMYANRDIKNIMGAEQMNRDDFLWKAQGWLNKSAEFAKGQGRSVKEEKDDIKRVVTYVVTCVLLNYNKRRHGPTYKDRVITLGREGGFRDEDIINVCTWAPYDHPVEFVADPTDETIIQWLHEASRT